MKLYLVQHAEAKSELEDPSRPLSDKGLKNIRKVAEYVKTNIHIEIDQIIHSGKLSANQTAEVLAEYVYPAKGVITLEGLNPSSNPEIWVNLLAESTTNITIVGHLPHLSILTGKLLCGKEIDVIAFQKLLHRLS